MSITRLVVDNYMRVTHVDLGPNPGVNEISGENGMGKTSLLDAISTLGGKGNVAWKPIQDGADEAQIIVEMDGVGEVPVRMIRKFRRNEAGETVQSVILEGPGGARFPRPQELLNAIVGEFSFDPLALLRMKPSELGETLKRFVPGFDFDANSRAYNEAFAARTDVNRRVKDLTSQVAGITVPAGTPEEQIDEEGLAVELQKVGEHNAEIERQRGARERAADESIRWRAEADSLDDQAAGYRKLAEEAALKAAEMRKQSDRRDDELKAAGAIAEPKDASQIRASLDRARVINRAVADLTRRNILIGQAERLQKEADDLTAGLKKHLDDKADAVKKAKMPVKGLGFDESGIVTFNGQPLDQASQAEKIRVSVAIAAKLSPKLKVAIVKDGSLLDKKSWALLEKYADDNGLQIFVETVESGRPTAVVIEDGRVRGEDAPKVAAE